MCANMTEKNKGKIIKLFGPSFFMNKIIYLHEDIFRKVSLATSSNLVLYLKFKLWMSRYQICVSYLYIRLNLTIIKIFDYKSMI